MHVPDCTALCCGCVREQKSHFLYFYGTITGVYYKIIFISKPQQMPLTSNATSVDTSSAGRSFHSRQQTSLSTKHSASNHASTLFHYNISFVFLSLQISFCPSILKNNPQNTLVTRWRLRIELVIGWKSEKSLLIYNSIAKNIWGFDTSPKVLRYGNPLFPTIFHCPCSKFRPWPTISLIRCYRALKPVPIDRATSI